VTERCCGQQFDTHVRGNHVAERQAKLVLTINGRFGAGDFGAVEFHLTAVFIWFNVRDTGTYDEITRLVSLSGERGAERQREEGSAEQGLVHEGSKRRFKLSVANGTERLNQGFDTAQ